MTLLRSEAEAAAPVSMVAGSRSRRKGRTRSEGSDGGASAAKEAYRKSRANSDLCLNHGSGSGSSGSGNGNSPEKGLTVALDLPPEPSEGHTEYKLKLVNPPPERFARLATQLNWRLNEGKGHAVYHLGVTDGGRACGISPANLTSSLGTMRAMAASVGAELLSVDVKEGADDDGARNGNRTAAVHLRRGCVASEIEAAAARAAAAGNGSSSGGEAGGASFGHRPIQERGVRVAVVGHAGAGKSTLVGVLSRGIADNGRGLARAHVFRHEHEVVDGLTSSLSVQAVALHFDRSGQVVSMESTSAPVTPAMALHRKCARTCENNPKTEKQSEEQQRPRRRFSDLLGDASEPPCSAESDVSTQNGRRSDVIYEAEPSRARSSSEPRRPEAASVSGVGMVEVGGCGAVAGGEGDGTRLDDGHGLRTGSSHIAVAKLTLLDLPGHEKFLKTTLRGMTGRSPDCAMLVLGATDGVQRMTREHLAIAVAVDVPLFVVVTKTDIATPQQMDHTLASLREALASMTALAATANGTAARLDAAASTKATGATKDSLHVVGTAEEAAAAATAMCGSSAPSSSSFSSSSAAADAVPVFLTSLVTGAGLPELRSFLGALAPPPRQAKAWMQAHGAVAEVRIDSIFDVDDVGTIYSGTVMTGAVCVGEELLLGPDSNGAFTAAEVTSIHVLRAAVRSAYAGQAASFALCIPGEQNSPSSGSHSNPDPTGLHWQRHLPQSATPAGSPDLSPSCSRPPPPVAIAMPLHVLNPSKQPAAAAAPSVLDPPRMSEVPSSLSANGSGGSGSSGRKQQRRRALVLVARRGPPPTAVFEFEAEVTMLQEGLRENCASVVYAQNIRQAARIVEMVAPADGSLAAVGGTFPPPLASEEKGGKAPGLESAGGGGGEGDRCGRRALCRFRFMHHPEYISLGTAVVLLDGCTRGFGKVLRLC